VRELIKYGKKMVQAGLAHSHFGNISKRIGNHILISTTGSMLDELEGNIVKVPLTHEYSLDILASSELKVHREIYLNTSALAILHGHSPFAVIISMLEKKDLIIPCNTESIYFIHEIPIVTGGVGSKTLAKNLALALKDHKGAIIKGHGPFARGMTVDEAYVVLSSIEHACHVKYFVEHIGK